MVVAIEPIYYRKVFGSVSWPIADTLKSFRTKIDIYKRDVINDIKTVSLKRLEKIRGKLCIEAELIDSNKILHVILRLMNARSRQKLEGKIGGAMLLLTMAEMLREII